MRIPSIVLVLCFQSIYLVFCEDGDCADPNAEKRFDSPTCVLTCKKRSIFETPGSCFRPHTLKEGCYCKQGFYLDEKTKKCVNFQACSCNATNHEASRFSNECANNCVTFHTRYFCSKTFHSQCWCDSEYCKASDGKCIRKELDFYY